MMGVLDYLLARRSAESAGVARERLHVVLEQERAMRDAPHFLPKLQRDLLGIVGRYIDIGDDSLRIVVEREGGTPRLGISVGLESSRMKPCDMPKPIARTERKARRLRQAAS